MSDRITPGPRRLIAKAGNMLQTRWQPSRSTGRAVRAVLTLGLLAFIAFALSGPATLAYPRSCTACHISKVAYSDWHTSSHASVRCERCHTDRAYLAGVGNSFALASDALGSLGGASGGSVVVPDSACTSCHPQSELLRPVVSGSLRMSHAGLAEGGFRCMDCHSGVAHKVPASPASVPTMSTCARCHNNVKVSGKCAVCHTQQKSADVVRRSDPEWSKTHGPQWRQLHGMGDLSNCTMCHEPQECQKCHGVPLPHDENFIADHGKTALQSKQLCLNCHNQSFCDNCHGFPIPHPAGFLPAHSKIAKSVEDPRCIRCHIADDCAMCHKSHVHPNGPGITPREPVVPSP